MRPELATIAVPATANGRNMAGEDFAVAAGWGHSGSGDVVMPGQGRAVERAYTASERAALGDADPILGRTTFDIYLNRNAFWRNVPAAVWTYKLGGYQVLKKWLSYRERSVLDRALTPHEVQYFSDVARRISAMLTILGTPPPRGCGMILWACEHDESHRSLVPLRDRCSFGRFQWLISQALSVTYMAGERRLCLERNCRLPESPAHSRRRNREGPASSKGLNSQQGSAQR